MTVSSTNVGGNLQFFPVWHLQPTICVLATMAVALIADMPLWTEAVGLALVGATTHTFMAIGSISTGNNTGGVATGQPLLLFE